MRPRRIEEGEFKRVRAPLRVIVPDEIRCLELHRNANGWLRCTKRRIHGPEHNFDPADEPITNLRQWQKDHGIDPTA